MNWKTHSLIAGMALLLGLSLTLAVILTTPHTVRANPAVLSTTPTAQAQQSAGPRTITFAYDDAGRLTQANYGQVKAIAYTYDEAGNLIQHVVIQMYKAYLPVVLRNR